MYHNNLTDLVKEWYRMCCTSRFLFYNTVTPHTRFTNYAFSLQNINVDPGVLKEPKAFIRIIQFVSKYACKVGLLWQNHVLETSVIMLKS